MGSTIVNVGELEVLVRPVPPTATVYWQKAHIDLPKKPGRPMVELTSPLDGHTEIVPALPESDEWDTWVAKMQRWYDAVEDAQNECSHEQLAYHMDYAIVGWRQADSEGEWLEIPPDDWNPPDVLRRHGVEVYDDVRLAYVMYVILDESWKIEAVTKYAWPEPKDSERDTSPITEEEVSAVMDRFRSGDEDRGGIVGPIVTSRGQRDQDERIRSRDAEGRGDGGRSGFLARIIKRK